MLTRTHSHKQAKGDSIELCLVTLRYVALRSERRSAAGPRLALAALLLRRRRRRLARCSARVRHPPSGRGRQLIRGSVVEGPQKMAKKKKKPIAGSHG